MTEIPRYFDDFERLRRLDRRGAVAVVRACCPAGERHALGLMMVGAARPGLVVMAGGAAFAGAADRARALGADHFTADARGARRLIRDLGKGKGGREP